MLKFTLVKSIIGKDFANIKEKKTVMNNNE